MTATRIPQPPCWPPQADDGPWVAPGGAQWVAVGELLRRCGDDGPPTLTPEQVWAAFGPLIPPVAAIRRWQTAQALRQGAHETECQTEQTASPASQWPPLRDAARDYQRAEAVNP